jgi:hypothetical protein
MSKVILIASTQLHLLDAIIIAQSERVEAHLFYIDRPSYDDAYFQALDTWKDNPFRSVTLLTTDNSSLFSKIKSKRAAIARLIGAVDEIKPSRLIVGNDRKNEVNALIMQYQGKLPVDYMDDGMHSYVTEQSPFYKYTCLDSLLKTWIYDHRITTPKQVGVSDYIRSVYLYRPALRQANLADKPAIRLDVKCLLAQSFQDYVDGVIAQLDINVSHLLVGLKGIFFLPHRMELDEAKLNQLASQLQGKPIAVKLHPRDRDSRMFFESQGITLLPNSLSAELLFLKLPRGFFIYGFKTTALLMASWLREDLQIYNYEFEKPCEGQSTIFDKQHIQSVHTL